MKFGINLPGLLKFLKFLEGNEGDLEISKNERGYVAPYSTELNIGFLSNGTL